VQIGRGDRGAVMPGLLLFIDVGRIAACLLEPFSFFSLLFLLYLPLCILQLLVGIEQGINLAIGVLVDGFAGLPVGFGVAGWIIVDTIDGNDFIQEDHAELYDLSLVKVELFRQGIELLGGSLGRRFLWSGSTLLSHTGADGTIIQGTVCRLCMDQTVEAHCEG
jgi:hypothetical protein